ncbi:MAG: ABC transporter permease subunit [Erysipelothrix sp.]|nr:ABC transporter permease subunit [Erysipelothrix sp.]
MSDYIKVFQHYKPEILKSFLETLNMLFTSMILSLIFGLLFGILLFAFRKDGIKENRLYYFFISSVINIVRSIPFILFIIVMIPINRMLIGTGFGVDASKVPLSIIGIATYARFVEQDLLSMIPSLYETSYNLGASKSQYFRHFLLVEARSNLVLSFTSTCISLLSYATVMGTIGGGGLGYLAMSEGYHNFNYKLMWILIGIMVLLVQVIQSVGQNLASKLDKR